jgi:parallel beta-helix repeat protein
LGTKNPHSRGAGLWIDNGASPTLIDCTFRQNRAARFGGGIYIDYGSNSQILLIGCTFIENKATTGAGIFNSTANDLALIDCLFEYNAASDCGGGIANLQGDVEMTSCSFVGNAARVGAGMYGRDSNTHLVDCRFTRNVASNSGGGLRQDGTPETGGASLTLEDCLFEENFSTYGGALNTNLNSQVSIDNSQFHSNRAEIHGGAIANTAFAFTLTNSTFLNNTAASIVDSDTAGKGGAIRCETAAGYDVVLVTVDNCLFQGNEAAVHGGAMYLNPVDVELINCSFLGNSAGGSGGAMHVYGSKLSMVNCLVSGNSATTRGGGIYNSTNDSSELTNCTFSKNTAGVNGGGIYDQYSDETNLPYTLSIVNSILWGNSGGLADVGDQIALVNNVNSLPTELMISYCDLEQGEAGIYTEGSINVAWGAGNIADDPLFVDADGLDNILGTDDDRLDLQENSPTIDAGNNGEVPDDIADLDGDGDTGERLPFDITGSLRFVDIPTVPDTGLGSPGIVDMGAYEWENDPPSVSLENVITTLAEDIDTSTRIKVADVVVTDDNGSGDNLLSLGGSDAGLFEVDGMILYLQAGASLDYGINPQLDVSVAVDDPSVGATPDDTALLSITILNINEPPAVLLQNVTSTLNEDVDTSSRIKVADILVIDDTYESYMVDDFESYTDDTEGRISATWQDGQGLPGNPGNGTGLTVGHEDVPYAEQTLVNSGVQSMPLYYDNSVSPFYSEAVRIYDTPQDWSGLGGTSLGLAYRGYPGQASGFSYDGETDTYTILGCGTDIGGTSDQFHFAYKPLNGSGSIVAKVESVENTNPWAKAGVMIRESLDPGSTHAMVVVTPVHLIDFEHRPANDTISYHGTRTDIELPYWVKLTRTGDTFTAEHSVDGVNWETIGSETIPMAGVVFMGLAVTSHAGEAVPCEAVFSNVTMAGVDLGPLTAAADIGLRFNAADSLYLAVEDSTGQFNMVSHPDTSAIQSAHWQEWRIDLADMSAAGVDLTSIQKLYIGIGDRDNPQPTGMGLIYVDDIVLYGQDNAMLSLSGSDAALFEIIGSELYLRAGVSIDYEGDPQLDVTVAVDDETVGTSPDNTAIVSIVITDVNEAPSIALENTSTSLAENHDAANRIKVADIVVFDDALGSNALGLGGMDAGLFEIDGTALYLRAGTSLDFETKPQLDLSVTVDDTTVGTTPDNSVNLSIAVSDGNLTLSETGWSDPAVGTWDQGTLTGTLTQDINDSIEVVDDGISLDGNGHASTGIGAGNGVYAYGKNQITIKNLSVNNFQNGISIEASSSIILTGNTATNNSEGIGLWNCVNNTLVGNTASNGGCGIKVNVCTTNTLIGNSASANAQEGIWIANSTDSILTGNTATGNNTSLDSTRAGIRIGDDCDNTTLTNNIAADNGNNGIQVDASVNNTLTGNIATGNSAFGISIHAGCSNSELINNTCTGNGGGIAVDYLVSNTTLVGNLASDNTSNGIDIFNSNDNTLIGNMCNGNQGIGISIGLANDNTVAGNTALNNTEGIGIWSSSNNTLTGNTASNGGSGIKVDGCTTSTLTNNIASSNEQEGIWIANSTDSVLTGNTVLANNTSLDSTRGGIRIGDACNNTTLTGNAVEGNGNDGVQIHNSSGSILTDNTITFNSGVGVSISGLGTGNTVNSNIIFGNTGLGIDLEDNGITLNDVGDEDSGPNNKQNFPEITDVMFSAGTTTIVGTLNSAAEASYSIDVYSNTLGDPSGHGEGESYLGATVCTTDDAGNGTWLLAVPADLRILVFAATATDVDGNTSEFSAPAPPNTAPTARDDVVATPEDTLVNIDVLVNDNDAEGDALVITILTSSNGVTQVNDNGTPANLTDDTVDFMPGPNFNGVAQFTYRINDGEWDSNRGWVTITVNPVNDAPVLAGIPDVVFTEDGNNSSIDLDDYYSDVETVAADATFTVTSSFAGVTANIDPVTHVLTITGDTDFNGEGDILIEVTDTGDGMSMALSDDDVSRVIVTPVNDAPVLDPIGDQAVNEQAMLAFTATATDVDLPPDTLTFSLDAEAIALGMVISPDGHFSWTPTDTQGGTSYEVTITVTDNGTPNLSASETISITVNDTPTTTGIDDIEVAEDAQDSAIDLFAAFDDVEDNDLDLIYEIQSNSNPTLFAATVIDANTGTLTLDYAPDINGSAEITVLATDTGGLTVETVFTVTVLSAEEQIDHVIDDMEVFKDTGVLSNGQANPPLNFLNQGIKLLGKGKTAKGIKKLNDFIDRIQDLIDDETLSAELGQALIDQANAAITAALPG